MRLVGVGFGVLGLVVASSISACSSSERTVTLGNGGGSSGGDQAGDPSAPASGTTSDNGGTTVPKSVVQKLATDVKIGEVAFFQALKGSVMKDGKAATPGVPLVADRDALVRVYVKPTSSYQSRELTAVLQLTDQDGKPLKAFKDARTLSGASTDDAIDSTFNFTVPGANLPVGAQFSVAITDKSADAIAEGTASSARYPADGSSVDVGVKSAGPSLKIVVVPVKYTADGSGRLPDTSDAQLKIDRDLAWSMYPVPNVDISVRSQPFTWSTTVDGSGNGWSELLQALADLRDKDGVADDVYYWGAFAAAPSQQAFCQDSCVMGLSTVVTDASDAYYRASIGVGFHGQDSAETMAHEVGHAHGRDHTPCSDFGSISGVDPNFPKTGHDQATLGIWGYDLVGQQLIAPTAAHDLMSYCQPNWVSDYTYAALFNRLATVNHGKAPMPTNLDGTPGSGSSNRVAYQTVTVGADGPARFGAVITPRHAVHGDAREVSLLDASGHVLSIVKGEFFRFDHLPGGSLLVPETGVRYAAIRVAGSSRVLSR